MNVLVPRTSPLAATFPAILRRAGTAACFAADEFFSARISNSHTRRAYARPVGRFLAWCEAQGIELRQVTPGLAGRFIEDLPGSDPTKNLALAALRHFFDALVTRHAVALNPFASVRGRKHDVVDGKYEACAETVPEAFGLSRSSVSRRYVKGTARKLAEFQERSLEGDDLVALFLDGKSFADEEISIALGVTLDGQKIPLGFVQAATGNRARLPSRCSRGMPACSVASITSAKTSCPTCPGASRSASVARWRRPTANRRTRRPRPRWTRSNRA